MSFQQSFRPVQRGADGRGSLSRLRPVTLLVACGIVLAATLLIVTGLVAGYLRERTLAASEAGLARLDAVLGETGNRSLHEIDALIRDVTGRIPFPDISTPDEIAREIREPAVTLHLDNRVEANPQIAGMAFVGADGALIRSAGDWPMAEQSVTARDYFVALQGDRHLDSYIGLPYAAGHDGALVIPVARKLRGLGGAFAGLAVATVPVGDFEALYRAVPLGDDGAIILMRGDGAVLARYPPAAAGQAALSSTVSAALADGAQGVFEEARSAGGQWRIDAIRPFADYPLVVMVSRNRDKALVGWSRQAAMFAAFAVFGVVAIAVMVCLIARQFQTHSTLATIRAEKIEMEHARLVAEAELMKKERLSVLGQFTATVATELRNPLSAIRNTLFTMREIAINSGMTLDRPIARIQRSIARCDRIIGDLLEYTRAPELSRIPVGFDRWLREVLAEHSLPATVSLVEQLDAGDATVRIDADRIRRVVVNLIDNAAQASGEVPAGGGAPSIAVRSSVRDGALELVVSDTGPGIPGEDIARIFQPLFSTKSFGTGLGLAMAKQIVDQHGGTIGIESTVGLGTAITIRLPLEQELKAAA